MTTAPGPGPDLARAALTVARRFSAGGTLWCIAPRWPHHAEHVAVEFVHPVVVGKRALPAVALTSGDVAAALRSSSRSGDLVLAVADGEDPVVADVMRRAPAWGVTSVWIAAGSRPAAGAADHVLWVPLEPETHPAEHLVRTYHVLWELAHVCLEHPGLLTADPECAEDVCITCSDEGRLAEVVAVDGDEATVRTADGEERIDVSFVDGLRPDDLVLVHAGSAIGSVAGGTT